MDSHLKLSSLKISQRTTLQKVILVALKYMTSTNKWTQNRDIQTSNRKNRSRGKLKQASGNEKSHLKGQYSFPDVALSQLINRPVAPFTNMD